MRSLGNQACHAPLPVFGPTSLCLGTPLRDPGSNHPRLEYRALHHRPSHPPPGRAPPQPLRTHTTRREMIQDTMAGRGPSPGEDAAARGRRLRQQELLLAAAAAVGSAERGVAAVKGEVPAAAAGRGRWRLLKGRPRCRRAPPAPAVPGHAPSPSVPSLPLNRQFTFLELQAGGQSPGGVPFWFHPLTSASAHLPLCPHQVEG